MGVLLALLSSGMWGTADFLAGNLSRKRSALAVAGAAQLVGLAVMLVVSLASGAWGKGVPAADYAGWSVLASFCGLGGLVAFYTALATGRMGIVSPIAALGVLVPLAAGLLQGERPAPWQMIGIVLAVVGVVMASGPELSGGAGPKPILLASAAAVLFGLFLVFVARGSEASAVLTITAQRMSSVVLVLVGALVARSLGGLRPADAPSLLVIGAFDVGANLAFSVATTMGLLAIISVLGSVYPVVTAVLAWLLLHERLQPVQYVGASVTVVAVVLIAAG